MKLKKSKEIRLLIIFLLFGMLLGYTIGTYVAIKAMVDVASNFVEIDMKLVQQAMFQYREGIGRCYNASVLYKSGNEVAS